MAGRFFAALTLFICAMTVSNTVFAECLDSDPNYGKSIEISNDATQKFRDGDYAGAGAGYAQAYKTCEEPTYLKNQMIAFFKGEMCNDALRAANEYAASFPNGEVPYGDRDDWKKVNMRCRVIMAESMVANKQFDEAEQAINESYAYGPTADDLKRIKTMENQIREGRAAKSDGKNTNPDPDPDPGTKTESESSLLPIIGWSALGVGAAIVTVGVILFATGPAADIAKIKEDYCFEAPCGDKPEYGPDQEAEWQAAADDASGLVPIYIAGGVIASAGIGVLIYHYLIADSGESQAVIAPTFDGERAGAVFQWRW